MLVALLGSAIQTAGMEVGAKVINLPDFDERVAKWRAGGVENLPAQMGDNADRGRDRIVDDQKVIVGVQRKMVGIERPLGGLGCADTALEFLGEDAALEEPGRGRGGDGEAERGEEVSP